MALLADEDVYRFIAHREEELMELLLDYLTRVGEVFVVRESLEFGGKHHPFCVLDIQWIFQDILGAFFPVNSSKSPLRDLVLRNNG